MEEKQQVIYMQARILRLAFEKWNCPMERVVDLFEKYSVLQYIGECFGIFHCEGDNAILGDIESYLKVKRGNDARNNN